MTEITLPQVASESRRLLRADADEWASPSRAGLVKAFASNKTRALPLQSMAFFEAEE